MSRPGVIRILGDDDLHTSGDVDCDRIFGCSTRARVLGGACDACTLACQHHRYYFPSSVAMCSQKSVRGATPMPLKGLLLLLQVNPRVVIYRRLLVVE